MANILIDIVVDSNQFILKGDIKLLTTNRRALIHLRDYLNAEISQESITVPYEEEYKENIIQEIQDLLSKFNIQGETTFKINQILSNYFQEEENFKKFSRQAYDIRNNLLDDLHKKEFKSFIESLKINLTERTLYDLQALASYHLTFSQNACNFSVPGSGKTSIVFGAYSYLKNLSKESPKKIDRMIIIGPLSSFGPWEDQYLKCFGHQPHSKRLAGRVKRKEKIKTIYSSNPPEMLLISYNGVPSLYEDIVFYLKKYKVMVVLDEAHKIKNVEGGIIAESVTKFARYCKSRVVLTGTPAPNGYEDIYNLFHFIWPTRNVVGFHLSQLKDMSLREAGSRVERLINNVSPYFIRIRKSDLKLPTPIENNPIIVKMGEIQRRIYNFVEHKYMNYLSRQENSRNIHDMLVRARLIRLMQVSTNPALLKEPIDSFFEEEGLTNDLFLDDSVILEQILTYDKSEIPSKYINAGQLIQDILNRNEKVIVWAIFVKNIIWFTEYLESIGIKSKRLYGQTPIETEGSEEDIETREGIIRQFHEKDSPFKVIVANPFAVSESISLHEVCHNAIYLERSFNAGNFIQSKDRIHRYGLNLGDKINYYYLLSDNNTDRSIHQRLLEKERKMMEIIENEPIPLFSRIDDELDDIAIMIKNYAGKISRTK